MMILCLTKMCCLISGRESETHILCFVTHLPDMSERDSSNQGTQNINLLREKPQNIFFQRHSFVIENMSKDVISYLVVITN